MVSVCAAYRLCAKFRCGRVAPSGVYLHANHVACNANLTVNVECEVVPGVLCDELDVASQTFINSLPCTTQGDKDWRVALLLSIFGGWLGVDRMYLGYTAIGIFKLCTFGFFLIVHLLDIILIALQVVQPADGTEYVRDQLTMWMTPIRLNNQTAL